MGEEFDKEAEREKLREKFEKDAPKREQTQRMSELLLQGATMTNHHCDRCGDPIFRDDGEEFCPSCGAEDEAATAAAASTDEGASIDADAPAEEGARRADVEAPAESAGSPSASTTETREAQAVSAPAPPAGGTEPAAGGVEHTGAAGGDPTDPRAELRRAAATAARKATAADDPRTATAWLEAAREASEALSALDR